VKPLARLAFQRLWGRAGAVSVRTKILGIILGLVLLLGLGTTIEVRLVSQRALLQRLDEQSVAIGRDVGARATDLILVNDIFSLHQLLAETQHNNPDVRYAFILDTEGQVLAHTFGEGMPADLVTANHVAAGEHHRTALLQTDEGRIWDTAVPIFQGRAGTARVGLSERSVHNTVTILTGQMLLTMILVSSVGVGAAIFLTWLVTRPILELKEAAQAVGGGDFSRRVRPWAGDEIGELAEAFNNMSTGLGQAEQERVEREQLRSQLLEKVIAAQEEERRRVARELHDETGQALTSLIVRLQTIYQQCPSLELKCQVDDLRLLLRQTLDGVHNMAVALRPSVLDDMGLVAALRRTVQDCHTNYPLKVDLVVVGLDVERLPPAVETALYRIIQEGLTNIVRHARATTASVLVERKNGRVRAIIEDDGIGFDPRRAAEEGRLGLYGMRERAELLNGTLTIETRPGEGTAVYIEVPV
jgi:signal transduction histidine kinase